MLPRADSNQRLPTEAELAEQHLVSRQTVRRAFQIWSPRAWSTGCRDAANMCRSATPPCISRLTSAVNPMDELWNHPVLQGRDRWREIATPGQPVHALVPPVSISVFEYPMNTVWARGAHRRRAPRTRDNT